MFVSFQRPHKSFRHSYTHLTWKKMSLKRHDFCTNIASSRIDMGDNDFLMALKYSYEIVILEK